MSDKALGYLRYFRTDNESEKGPAYEGLLGGAYFQFRPKNNHLVKFNEDKTEVVKEYKTQKEDSTSFTLRSPKKDEMSLLYYRKKGDDGNNFAVHAGIMPRFNRPTVAV